MLLPLLFLPICGNLLVINIDSKSPTATGYSSLVSVSGPQATPEPGTLTLIVIGLGSVASGRFRLRKTHLIFKWIAPTRRNLS
jgi:PEP-CTERM motif-containing protein